MNWKELRPLLRERFGRDFHFYNDMYRSGTRRIKICTKEPSKIVKYIRNKFPELNVNLYVEDNIFKRTRVTIHYK